MLEEGAALLKESMREREVSVSTNDSECPSPHVLSSVARAPVIASTGGEGSDTHP